MEKKISWNDVREKSHKKETRSPMGNMWSAIPVALLGMIVNLSEGVRGSASKGDKVL